MPTLPDFTALGERPTPQPAGGVATYEPGNPRYVGLAGQELSTAGHELEGASDIVAATNERQDRLVQQANERQDDIAAQAGANQLKQAAITQEFDPQQGFRNAKGGNAVGQPFLDAYTQKFGDAQQQVRDGLQNDNQRRLFDRYAQVSQLQFHSALLAHQSQETERFNDQTADNTVELSLRSMGQNPTNELTFQTELARINGTIDQAGQRKGLPPEAVKELKGKLLDAAYTTRVTSILQGVPGVAQANPYLAEKMFEQVQDQLGPQAQVHLAAQVQKGVQSIQARDTAHGFIFGFPPALPSQIAPAAGGAPLQGVVQSLESGGQDFDAQGNLLTSPKGAQGRMQVMPATARDPGYGVVPARDDSPQELARVGRDYLGAMSARYNEPALVLAAYNAGPGQVDKWLAQNGDPRGGGMTPAQWAARIPFTETRDYVMNGLRKLAAQGGAQDAAPIIAPTAQQLKKDLYARVQAARQVAQQQYPGDTAYEDSVAARVEGYGRNVLAQATAQEQGARDTLLQGVMGSQPDGSDAPKTIDTLLADPQMRAAWEQATPETKLALQGRYAKGDKGFDADSFGTYYGLLGKAADSPDDFTQVDLGQFFGKIPDAQLMQLANMQRSMSTKDAKAAARDLNWAKAKSSVEDMLKPIGLGATAKANTPRSVQTEQFYGRLNEALQQFHDANNKWPDTQATRQMAATLLMEGKQAGGLFYDSGTRLFQSPDKGAQFYVPLPSDSKQLQSLQDSFTKVMGHAPTKSELQNYYTRYRLAGGK